MPNRCLFISLVLLCILPGVRLVAAPLSLADAVQIALRNNPDIAASAQDVAIARTKFAQVDALALPHLSLDAGVIELSSTPEMSLPSFTLPTAGGPLTLSLPSLPLANSTISSGSLNVALPIFTGGRVKYGHAQVAAGVEALQAVADARRRDVAWQTIQAYLGAVLAQNVAEVATQASQTVTEHLQAAQRLFAHGQIPRYEVIRAQTEQVNAERRRLDARNQEDLALAYLQDLLGGAKDDTPTLTTVLSGTETMDLSLPTLLQQSIASSSEMQALRARDRLYVAAEKAAQAEIHPLVAGVVSQKLYMNAQPFSTPASTVALELNMPLYDGGLARARVKEGEAQRTRNADDVLGLQNGISLAVRKHYLDLLNSREALNAADEGITLAQEGLRLAQRRFEEEQGTDLEVNDAVLALSIAQTNREQARYQYDIAYYGLKTLTGELFSVVSPVEGVGNGVR